MSQDKANDRAVHPAEVPRIYYRSQHGQDRRPSQQSLLGTLERVYDPYMGALFTPGKTVQPKGCRVND